MRGKGGGLHPVVVLKERELSLVAGFKERGKQISGRKWWNQPGPKMKATVGGAVWFVFGWEEGQRTGGGDCLGFSGF